MSSCDALSPYQSRYLDKYRSPFMRLRIDIVWSEGDGNNKSKWMFLWIIEMAF